MKKSLVFVMAICMIMFWSVPVFAGVNDPVEKDEKGWIVLKVGVGSEGGIYNSVVRTEINKHLRAWKVRLDPVYGGSTKSMELMKSGELVSAIVQGNAPVQPDYEGMDLESFGSLHDEYIHFAGLQSGKINEFSDLTKEHTVAIGKMTGGSAMTWADFVRAVPKLKAVSTSTKSGTRARKALEGKKVDGWFAVTGLGDRSFKEASNQKGMFELFELDYGALKKFKFNGESVYKKENIDDDVYPGLFPGITNGSVQSWKMVAQFIVNTEWVDNNENLYEKIVKAVDAARPAILKKTDND